jgi:hypothetical protein
LAGWASELVWTQRLEEISLAALIGVGRKVKDGTVGRVTGKYEVKELS